MTTKFTAIFAAAMLTAQGAAALEIGVGQAMRIDSGAGVAQVIVGDPKIADVAVDPGGKITLFGKRTGATTLIVLNRAGKVMREDQIAVRSGGAGTVVVTYGAGKNVDRGGTSVVHACGDGCSRVEADQKSQAASGGAGQ